MKHLILIIAIVSVLVWPINYFSINQKHNLSPQTIFESDYQARQLILRNINLYPNILLARIFQNKAIIIIDKYFSGLFDLIDPNYYFFGSHPREVPGGQNYTRLPLLTLLPIFWFLFRSKNQKKKSILSFYAILILFLSLFTNHFIYDFLLWLFFIPVIYIGLFDFYKHYNKSGVVFSILLLVEILYEMSLTLL